MFVATLVAEGALGQGEVDGAASGLSAAGFAPATPVWIEAGSAADIGFDGDMGAARALLQSLPGRFDVVVQPRATRAKKLIVADMDSTMITVECIDELADYAGIKAQVADVTERAMRGELDFAQALTARVALLKGLADEVIDQCRTERVVIMPGAKALVQTMRARGAEAILVSGGFTRFTGPVAQEIGFNANVANVLGIEGRMLSGEVAFPIVDAARKRTELEAAIARLGIDRAESLAVGDGANDIPMIEGAGLGVAYHGKEKLRAAADAEINHGDLRVMLYAQGLPKADWATQD